MSNHVGKYVVSYRCTIVKTCKVLLAMTGRTVIKRFTFAVFECRWLNNTIKILKILKH